MRFLSPILSRKVSSRRRASVEPRRMLIFIGGLVLFISYLPVSNGAHEGNQEVALCLGNTCYTVHLNKAKFLEAHRNCTNRGGDLVSIKSEKEAETVHTLLQELTRNTQHNLPLKLWIGLKLKQCVIDSEVLKGFYWTAGDNNTAKSQFSNWLSRPKSTCTKEMCVSMMLHRDTSMNFKWVDSLCSAMFDGYICKFDFNGMCPPLTLAGPGIIEYETPFSFKGSPLNLLPHGTLGYVSCNHHEDGKVYSLLCIDVRQSESTVYQWVDPRTNKHLGAVCFSEELGCNFNNGGCKHKCMENAKKGSVSCQCNDGYVLAPDMVSCVLPDHCQSHPCEHNCINLANGPQCTCPPGFALAENKRSCVDIDECLEGPCNHICINTVGSFHCNCPAGFTLHGTHCLDVDECIQSTCAQGCLNTNGSYHCSCHVGYVLGSDKKSCLDVDECIDSPCAHSCENVPGSYTCTCPKAFELSSDRISCIPEVKNENVTPTGHQDKASGPKNKEATSNSLKVLTNQPTPSSAFHASNTEKQDKRRVMLATPTPSETSSSASSSVDQVISDHPDGYSVVLLASILCACGVVLVLLVVAGGFLCYRKNKAKKKETEKQSSATDKYCWVPESENKVNNDYR